MKLKKKVKTHFTFVSKADMDTPGLMEPQNGCKDKSVNVFGSGNISMDVHTKRMGYMQGEALRVTAEVSNHSTRSAKPKFILYEKKSFFAQGHQSVSKKIILKEKSEAVASSAKETVTKVFSIPTELPPSILNCSIIKLEYKLRICLDVKFASNPEIKLPIVILPSFEVPAMKPPAAVGFGFNAFEDSDQAPCNTASQAQAAPQEVDPPPSYEVYSMYPSEYTSAL
ncbi:hypothetical protein FQN60_017790 [Etheostoma spectabile]|uniref:Arrestin C-terminal-like domain-containing protein n=2 Tax=Etheostoma spectabile TaxID=54343 RepID=A0A5J5DG72_9PERO|nr:hypothetical protein FQN60_017790 [Etheostoma spectabile]